MKTIDSSSAESTYSTANSGAVAFIVDTTDPTVPTNLTSSDHTPSTWSTDDDLTMTWTAATDDGSGLSGYSYIFDTTADTTPNTTQDIGTVTTVDSTTLADGNAHYFHIRAVDALGNWGVAVHSGPYFVDTTDPTVPTNLTSSDHTPSTWSTDDDLTITWTAATDDGSGLSGYSYIFDTSPNTIPNTIQDIGTITTVNSTVLSDGNGHYFHIRAVDGLGTWGSAVHSGPFYIDTTNPAVIALSTTTPTTDTTPTWSWAASDASSGLSGSYAVQWSKDSVFGSNVSSSTVSTTSFTHSTALAIGTWYLRVQATDVAGNQTYSSNGSVIIEAVKEAELTIIQKPSTSSTEPAPTTDQEADEKTGLVDLTIIINSRNQPLIGANVELHSDPRYGTTDSGGQVVFTGVEPGQHELIVRYGRRVASSIILVGATQAEPIQTITVVFNDPPWYTLWSSWVGIAVALLVGLLIGFYRRRRHT